jgi:hypothetical protein
VLQKVQIPLFGRGTEVLQNPILQLDVLVLDHDFENPVELGYLDKQKKQILLRNLKNFRSL